MLATERFPYGSLMPMVYTSGRAYRTEGAAILHLLRNDEGY
jgi:hypothetical protein